MDYFNRNIDEFSELNLKIETKLTFLDRNIFQFLFILFQKNEEKTIMLEIKELNSKFNLEKNSISKYFDKLMKKKVKYSFEISGNLLIEGVFYPLTSYSIMGTSIYITLAEEIQDSFKKNNFFSYINLTAIFKFNNSYTLNVYLKILNLLSVNKYKEDIFFCLSDIKKLLEMDDSYNRFYDFENKVLIPIIKDLNEYTNFEISYSKIKRGEGKSSKVIGINLECINISIKQLKDNSNIILSKIKYKVTDFNLVQNLIVDYLKNYSFDYVKYNAYFALKNHKKIPFERYLQDALQENFYGYNNFLKATKILSIKKYIHTINGLYNEINSLLIQLKLIDIIYQQNFHIFLYSKFYSLIDGNIYREQYIDGSLILKFEILYNKDKKSKITIEKN